MAKIKPLRSEKLRARMDPKRIPYKDSREIPLSGRISPPQPRALQALELALSIPGKEYNVFVSGDPSLGRTYLVRQYLEPRAAKAGVPRDWIYVHNFDDPDRPRAVSLPAGQAKVLKSKMVKAVSAIRREIPARFEQDVFAKKRERLLNKFRKQRDKKLEEMDKTAREQGFKLNMEENGALTLLPVVDGKTLSDEEFEALDQELKDRLRKQSDKLLDLLMGGLRELNKGEKDFKQNEEDLERATVADVVGAHLDPIAKAYRDNKALADYLAAARNEFLDNIEMFKPREVAPIQPYTLDTGEREDFFRRFEINLFVDNSSLTGAPVVVESHPTYFNLMGCIEREAEWGALYTDFTLIKPGALHRANGGYLILHVDDVLKSPAAWEGLLRALRSGLARVEDPGDYYMEPFRTKTIEPAAIPLNVKVVLIGMDETYEALLIYEERFTKLFKLKAHIQETMPRNNGSVKTYLKSLAVIIRDAGLPPFDRGALAGLLDFSSRLADDQEKLSLRLTQVRELMIEAAAMAKGRNRDVVDARAINEAIAGRDYRANLYEEEFMAEYDREAIKVPTQGSAVGRANGLSVSVYGDFVLALPHQIACTVGVGHGGIIDLEREAELGGPIHTKGMMILKSYLVGRFAQDKPIVLTGSLCFEQSYAHLDGDSASGAELAALLSALADVPVDMSLAFTGAVSQSGAIMAVGDVTRKVEGFFEVCRRRGLTGKQGVIIPHDNIVHLMLKDDLAEAVNQGMFHIYPVKTIEQAMEILTGIPAERRTKTGRYSRKCLYYTVDKRLAELADLAEKSSR